MHLTCREWLALTRRPSAFYEEAAKKSKDYALQYNGHYPNDVRPWAECADGFRISIQAGWGLYCTPYGVNLEDGNYESVELGYPSEEEPLIFDYAEGNGECGYTSTVYAQVPVEIVDKVLEKHGGIVNVQRVSRYLRGLERGGENA